MYNQPGVSMTQDQITAIIMAVCIVCSGFFSGSETAVTAVNRYRLQYLAHIKKQATALTLFTMLKHPQKLLGMILIANTFLNMLVSSLATAVTINWLGEQYVLMTTMLLTLIVLIFAEVLPKSVAAHHADTIAYRVAPALSMLLWLLSPLVIIINALTTLVLRLVGVRIPHDRSMDLSRDELGNLIKLKRQKLGKDSDIEQMLEGILDLDDITIEDVMLPRTEVSGIDISEPWVDIIKYLKKNKQTHVMIYDSNIDQILGAISMQTVTKCLLDNKLSKETLTKKMCKMHFVPETTKLEQQLRYFKEHNEYIAAVVDEYGQLCGVVHLEDIIDEVVGGYASGLHNTIGPQARHQSDQYWFYGKVAVRDINKAMNWHLPEDKANSIGGLVVEWLEQIPETKLCVVIESYKIEILQIKNNQVHRLKITPPAKEDEQARNTEHSDLI